MGELSREKADRLADTLAEQKTDLNKSTLERYENDTQTGHNYRTEDYFIKIERYFNQRERISAESAVLQNIEIQTPTPCLVDQGHINGYNYRIFNFLEGKSLSHKQEHGFEQLDREDQVKRIKQMGEALAKVHKSKSFQGFGNIETLNNDILGTSNENWSEGLKEIQYFWHHHVGGRPFNELQDKIEEFYKDKETLLNQVNDSVLIHQELGFHNVLFREDEVTIVDWESSGAGDPLLDVITTEVILFWFQGLDNNLRQNFREAYRSVRELEIEEELVDVYRLVELSRLLIVFDNDEDKVSRIQDEILSIVSN